MLRRPFNEVAVTFEIAPPVASQMAEGRPEPKDMADVRDLPPTRPMLRSLALDTTTQHIFLLLACIMALTRLSKPCL